MEKRNSGTIAYILNRSCYLNITNRCTLRCRFCPKFNGEWDVQGYDLRLQHEPDTDEILAAVGDPAAYDEVVFCGLGEPTLRLDVLIEVANAVKCRGGKVRLNTDGLANMVYGRNMLPELSGCVDTVSISMNAHNAWVYEQHCRPQSAASFDAMLAFAIDAVDYFPRVIMTALDGLPGVDIERCREIAANVGATFRSRALGQVGVPETGSNAANGA
jgi:TatD family-associated radical SAM protein